MNEIKSFLITMGIGFVVGAVVTASNRKVLEVAKQAKQMADEKCELIKEGFNSAKEKIEDKMEEKKEEELDLDKSNNKKTKKA